MTLCTNNYSLTRNIHKHLPAVFPPFLIFENSVKLGWEWYWYKHTDTEEWEITTGFAFIFKLFDSHYLKWPSTYTSATNTRIIIQTVTIVFIIKTQHLSARKYQSPQRNCRNRWKYLCVSSKHNFFQKCVSQTLVLTLSLKKKKLFSRFFSPFHPAESSVLQHYNAACSAVLQTILPEKTSLAYYLLGSYILRHRKGHLYPYIPSYCIAVSLLGAHIMP